MIIQGLEGTFDTVAPTYEKLRPGYVDELYRTLFAYLPVTPSSRVIEVGSGGGQATAPLLKKGCALTAVEYGAHFCDILKEKFAEYPKFSVITGKFEDVPLEENAFDLVYSASAFHWVPEKIGYEKVYSMLKKCGAFARFANHPYHSKGNPTLRQEIDEIYEKYYFKFYNRKREERREYSEEQARTRAMIAAKYGFSDIQYHLFYRDRFFTAKEYAELLGTYSDHIVIDEPIRKAFFSAIEAAIRSHGDTICVHDTIDLQLARKQ